MEIWTPNYIQVKSLNFRGWRDVIGCVTVGPGMCGFLYVVSNNHTSILHSYGDNEPQRYCGSDYSQIRVVYSMTIGSDLDNAGHVTLPVTRPFDSPCALSYSRSVITMHQSWTVVEIWSLKPRVTFLTFCGHVTSSVRWYSASKILGSRPWPFGVTWRHRSRDYSTPHVGFPIGGQWWPCVYLAPLVRYKASK